MGEVVYLTRPGATEGGMAPGPMRQPSGARGPASHFVRLGDLVDNLMARLEERVIENGITLP